MSDDTSIKASRLDLPYQLIRHQPIPGGVLLTCCHVVRPPPGIVGSEPQVIPACTVFLPGIYLADAVDSNGARATFAVRDGVTLGELGLKPYEAPMGGMVMG